MSAGLDRFLELYASKVATRRVAIGPGILPQLPALVEEALGAKRSVLLIADPNTWSAAGRRCADVLFASGFPLDTLLLEPRPEENKVHPDEDRVEQVAERLRANIATPLAVGAGTINDIVKMASFRAGRPYVVLATAPSMNGWTSAIAAIISRGLKTTQPAHTPVLVVADTDVLCAAPDRMVGAGFADLMAKWVASGDWHLADRLLGTGFDSDLEEISMAAIRLLEGREKAIAERQVEAIALLMEALCISGLSMAVAASSAHISGAEHLFSHYIDMMLPDVSERELHGRQVGIGTLCSAAIYEMLLAWSPERLDVQARVARQQPWSQRRQAIVAHFGERADAVLDQARQIHAEGDALAARLERFKALWPELRSRLAEAIAPRGAIQRRLAEAGAPTHFSQIGLDARRVAEILTWAKDIRARYTVLHLAADLGLLDEWIEAAIAAFDRNAP